MLHSLASQFRAAPDWAYVPDPWLARPLRVLRRLAQEEWADVEVLALDVLMVNPSILDLVDAHTVAAIEAKVWPESEDDRESDFRITGAWCEGLAERVAHALGEGFEIGLRRSGHPEWQAWVKANPSKQQQVLLDSALRSAATHLHVGSKRGFRTARRPTRAQMRREIGSGLSVQLTPDEARALADSSSEDLRSRKVGIATALMCEGWRGSGLIDQDTGELAEYTLAGRLELLGLRLTGTGSEGTPIVEDSPLADGDGHLVRVSADHAYGPAPLGDAIAAWLIDASGELEEGHGEWLEDQARPLPDTQRGTGDTSEAASSES